MENLEAKFNAEKDDDERKKIKKGTAFDIVQNAKTEEFNKRRGTIGKNGGSYFLRNMSKQKRMILPIMSKIGQSAW
eukprot:scaffold97848_cov69-Attheya_sp.AAC.5